MACTVSRGVLELHGAPGRSRDVILVNDAWAASALTQAAGAPVHVLTREAMGVLATM